MAASSVSEILEFTHLLAERGTAFSDFRSMNGRSYKLNPQINEAMLTTAIYIALTGYIFWPILAGHRSLLTRGDSFDQSFMWLTKVFAATRSGQIALWDFGVMSGTSFIGELQTSALYPVAWLFGVIVPPGDPHGFDLFVVTHYFIAALGFHVLCRTLGLTWVGAVVGAVIFAFGSGVALRSADQPQLHASLAWLPWVVTVVQWSLRARSLLPSVIAAAVAGASTALSFLAGHVHVTIMAVVASIIVAPVAFVVAPGEFRLTQAVRRGLVCFSTLLIFAVALSLPQLAATTEYLRLAYKWYGPGFTSFPHIVPYDFFIQQSLQRSDLSTLITGEQVGMLDGGTLFLTPAGLFAIFLVVFLPKTNWGLIAIGLCALVLMLGGLSFASPNVLSFGWFYYHVPIINLVRSPARGLFLFAFGGAMLAAVGISAVGHLSGLLCKQGAHWLDRTLNALLLILLLVCVVQVSLWLPSHIFRQSDGSDAVAEHALDNPVVRDLLARSQARPLVYRFNAGPSLVPANIGDIYPLLSSGGYRSSRTVAYHDYFNFDPGSPRMDRLGVRWWVTKRRVGSLPLVATIGNAFIQERPTALPVFWLADDTPRGTATPIKTVSWDQNEVTVVFARPIEGRLVFAQMYYPGWSAIADGQSVPVSRFDRYASIKLTSPTNKVSFRYNPAWWRPTVFVALCALISLLCGVIYLVSRPRFLRRDPTVSNQRRALANEKDCI